MCRGGIIIGRAGGTDLIAQAIIAVTEFLSLRLTHTHKGQSVTDPRAHLTRTDTHTIYLFLRLKVAIIDRPPILASRFLACGSRSSAKVANDRLSGISLKEIECG